MAIRGARVTMGLRSTLIPTGDYDGGIVIDRSVDEPIANGTSAGMADKQWSDSRALASTNEDLDLQTLTDANGVALALAELTTIMIEVPSTNSANLVIEPGASNGFAALFAAASSIILRPGATLLVHTDTDPGWVVDATHKVLNVENLGTGSYRITLLGRSA